MNIKIQGGGSGTYANTGSCTGVTTYLQHEDLERMKNGREVQPFFNNSRDYISAQEVTFKIDNNKAKLSRNDAKFYVITVSPSSRELEKMGKTEKEQAEAMRKYVRDDVMQHYAEGFGKGLNKEDIEYYGKIHFERKGADRYDMHAHIIVSRKDRSNTRKLSPKTNHTGKKNCGNVKGGFDRTDFFRKCETSFDKRTGYDRAPEQTFDYLNTMKNGSPKEIFQKKEWAERVNHERLEKMKAEWSRDLQEPRQEQGREEIQQQGNSISQVPDIDQVPQRKKQQQEELDQPRKRSRGFGQNIAPYEILNISYDADAKFMKEEGDLTHMIGVMSTREMSKQLEKLPVEAGLWAVFPNEGLFPSTLQQTWARIYSEWLLSSNYELIDNPSFSFTKMDELKKDFAYSEIWIPIKEK